VLPARFHRAVVDQPHRGHGLTPAAWGTNLPPTQSGKAAAMEIRNLGQSGLRVSSIGLGCNNFGGRIDEAATKRVIHKALDLGITLFDTADTYGEKGGSETVMGNILGADRQRIVLATKFASPMDDSGEKTGGSRRYIMTAVEDSLRRLRTDWIDLYQMHRVDPNTPIEETLRALDDLIRQGKVRYIGCSNFPAWQMTEASWTARTAGLNGFVSCQDEYSLVHRAPEAELIPAARKLGFGLLPFFPLASGLLTGKYRRNTPLPAGTRLAATQRLADRYLTERNWEVSERLGDYAETRGHTMLELAFSWLLAQSPVASVIAGATRTEQLEQNARAGSWKMTAEDLAEIGRIAG
jgi:aryl-alcohol dehydrogenase-like predicted oxidoreductase